jgi:hypothetical protein
MIIYYIRNSRAHVRQERVSDTDLPLLYYYILQQKLVALDDFH